MPYFHIHIEYVSKNTRLLNSFMLLDCSEEHLRSNIIKPIMSGMRFVFGRVIIYPELIESIVIYETEKKLEQILEDHKKEVLKQRGRSGLYYDKINTIDDVIENIKKGEIGRKTTYNFISSFPERDVSKRKPIEIDKDLISFASFLGLDQNWSSSTCALQLQEVAVILVAKKKGIELSKKSVERILNTQIKETSFKARPFINKLGISN